ncbi:MAG TPA: hypothetical protein PKB09_03565 [Candidatus Saccharibacteria bacterium]|nr:hypothetical protein [Candidatus Saccharibacteria bacterium]
MKKLNNKGFGHIEIFILVAVVAVTALIGGFVWQNSKSKDSSADTVVKESSSRTGIKRVGKYKGVQIYACRASSKPRDGVKIKATNDGSSSLRRGIYVKVNGPNGTTPEDKTTHLHPNGDYVANWFQYPNPSYKWYKFNSKIWLAKNFNGKNKNPLVVLHISPLNGEKNHNLPDIRFKNLNLCS